MRVDVLKSIRICIIRLWGGKVRMQHIHTSRTCCCTAQWPPHARLRIAASRVTLILALATHLAGRLSIDIAHLNPGFGHLAGLLSIDFGHLDLGFIRPPRSRVLSYQY